MRARTIPRYDPPPSSPRPGACAAEARAQAAEAETAQMEAEMEQLSRAVRQERMDALAVIDSPVWHRDLLLLARDQVQAELISLATRHEACAACGSFGRGFQAGFLQAAIDALTDAHDLPPINALADVDWPVQMGRRILKGRALDRLWLQQPQHRARAVRAGDWDRT